MAELKNKPVHGAALAATRPDQLCQSPEQPQLTISNNFPALYPGQTAQEYPYLPEPIQVNQGYRTQPPPFTEQTSQNPDRNQPRTQTHLGSLVNHKHRGKLLILFGTLNILLVALNVILNGIALIQKRNEDESWGLCYFTIFPAAISGVFIVLAAAFAIASGVHRTRCLLATHLVMAVIASFFSCGFFALSIPGIMHEKPIGDDYITFVIVVVWCASSIIMMVTITWSSVISCKVICTQSVVDRQP